MAGAAESVGQVSALAGSGAPRPGSIARVPRGIEHGFLFWSLIAFLILEFARPPGIVQLRLQMAISSVLPICWLFAKDRTWSPILTAQTLYLLVCAAMVPIAYNNFAAYFETRVMFANLSVVLAMTWLWARRDAFRIGFWCWFLIMVYVSWFAISAGGKGTGGFLGDENDLALGACTAFPFAFFGFQRLKGWKRWGAAAGGVLIVMAVVTSASRGGFLGLGGGFLYCFLTSRNKLRNSVFVAAALAAFLVLVPRSYLEEMDTMRDTNSGTADARQFLWETAYNMWKAYPLLGVGGGGFGFQAGDYQATGPRWDSPDYQERNWSGTTVHSLYFQMLSEHGTAGIALFVVLVYLHFRTLRRLRRDAHERSDLPPDLQAEVELFGGALAGAMVAFLVAGTFISVAQYPYFWYFTGLAATLDTAVRREFPEAPPVDAAPRSTAVR